VDFRRFSVRCLAKRFVSLAPKKIPEPSSWWLLGLGLMGVARVGRMIAWKPHSMNVPETREQLEKTNVLKRRESYAETSR